MAGPKKHPMAEYAVKEGGVRNVIFCNTFFSVIRFEEKIGLSRLFRRLNPVLTLPKHCTFRIDFTTLYNQAVVLWRNIKQLQEIGAIMALRTILIMQREKLRF